MTSFKQVLIVGAGSIGERHLRTFQATGRVDLSLCEVNPTLRAAIAEKYGIRRLYDDLQTALADQPQAMVIATPAHLHVPMLEAGIEAGVHLLVEKPLALSTDGLDELLRRAYAQKLAVRVAYTLRSHPAVAAMRQAIVSRRFGEPVEVIATSGQHFPLYRPAYRQIYYRDHATGGGAVQDAFTHLLDAAQWMVGPITELAADIGHFVLEGVEVEDTAHVLTRHGSVPGCYSLNQHQAPDESTLSIVCRGGTVRFESHQRRWRWMSEPGGAWHDEPCPQSERDSWFVAQANAFLDAIEVRPGPLCTLAEGAHTVRVHAAIYAAAASRAWQKIEPANRLLYQS